MNVYAVQWRESPDADWWETAALFTDVVTAILYRAERVQNEAEHMHEAMNLHIDKCFDYARESWRVVEVEVYDRLPNHTYEQGSDEWKYVVREVEM
jgi:hypothetical protein